MIVKKYANLNQSIHEALKNYVDEVKTGRFPEEQYTYGMPREEAEKLQKLLKA